MVLSSVAGLRARKSNYLYGAAKAGLDTFACGLADALATTGVRLHLIRPGFVHTRMTAGLDPAPFASDADTVAVAIAAAVGRPRSSVVHVPRALGPLFGAFRARAAPGVATHRRRPLRPDRTYRSGIGKAKLVVSTPPSTASTCPVT